MSRPVFFPIALCLAASSLLQAQVMDALATVPRNAQGLVVVRDPAGVRTKVEALMARLKEDPQKDDPYKDLLAEFGLEKLPDETRGLVVAFLPQEGVQMEPVPVLITAVGDFKAWCESLKATTKDKVHFTFQKGDKHYVTGLKGRWAFIAASGHAPALKKALLAQGSVLQELEDLPTWMMEADAAVAMTPRGFQALSFFAKDSFRKQRAGAGAGHGSGAPAPVDEQLEAVLHKAEREVILMAARITMDDQGNLGGTLRLRLHPSGEWAGYGRSMPLPADAGLRHLPALPYLMAMGGSLPKAWILQLSEIGTLALKPLLSQVGMKPEAIRTFQAKHAEAQEVFQGLGAVVPTGEAGVGVPVIRLDVEDATAALERQDRFIREVGPLFKESGLVNPYVFELREVEGYPAGMLTTHVGRLVPRAEGTPEIPPVEMGYLAPDAQTLFLGLSGAPSLVQAAATYRDTSNRLAADPQVQTTVGLLPGRAHFYGYVNVGAIVGSDDGKRRARLPEGIQADIAYPTMPAVPPLGLALHFGVDRWELHVTFPAALQQALGEWEAANKVAKEKEKAALEAWEKEHPTPTEEPLEDPEEPEDSGRP